MKVGNPRGWVGQRGISPSPDDGATTQKVRGPLDHIAPTLSPALVVQKMTPRDWKTLAPFCYDIGNLVYFEPKSKRFSKALPLDRICMGEEGRHHA